MEMKNRVPFTSSMSAFERAAALGYIPVHVLLLPWLLVKLLGDSGLSAAALNAVCYAAAAAVLFVCLRRFFRREFDALCDYGPAVLLEVIKHYGALLLCGMGVGLILILAGRTENPNNGAVASLAGDEPGLITAAAVFLAPIAEEAMFRGGVFGLLRPYSRFAAYCASILLFSAYHLWAFALGDPTAWIYLLQYLPPSFLLARIYEKTNSLWAPIFLHMTVNGVSMLAVRALGAYL